MADETGKSSGSSSDKQPAKVQRSINANEGRPLIIGVPKDPFEVTGFPRSHPQGKGGQTGNQQNGGDE